MRMMSNGWDHAVLTVVLNRKPYIAIAMCNHIAIHAE